MFLLNKRLITAFLALSIGACDLTSNDDKKVVSSDVKDLPADPAVLTGSTSQPKTTGRFTFFSFKDNKIIANTDSATTKWDVGFRATTIIVNSGSSGPGNTQAQVLTGSFDELTTAPTTGYYKDDKANTTRPFAIPVGSGNGWFNYNGATQLASPIPGKLLLFKTTDGKYVKLQILSYYKGAPIAPDALKDTARHYTFRYVYQGDGSATFPAAK
ncbi:MAG: HmuY family protein [Bacteroidetes Order II. Incertae sedis bacterium]|nr:HmuY family protein [Bacteroidetes Order II. bacterium]